MKRSEALELITDTYIEYYGGNESIPDELVNKILTNLEKAGMQPPEMSEQVTYEDEVYTVFKYQWEQE